jgi:hypothetical protein
VTALVAALAGCGGKSKSSGDPVALAGTASDACSQAIMDGHNMEAAGKPMPFLASVRQCSTLAEWTAAAKGFGIDLNGREPQFVDNTCSASGADVQSLPICQEARAAVNGAANAP